MPVIWCVEDDSSIREIEVYVLNTTGMEAYGFENGTIFWETIQVKQPDLVLLDVMLPGVDGVELLSRMKSNEKFRDIPVVMATAKGTEYDKVQSLDLGADDYLVKPFGMMEMVSRVKAVLRRSQPRKNDRLLTLDKLVLDLEQHIVSISGERIALTYKEYELLKLFLSQPGVAFTREQLLQKIWNTDYVSESRTVDMHIRTLRQKLGSYGNIIETVRNVGYRLESRHDQ